MSRTVVTFNEYHLGDGLIFLHLLRAIAKAHVSTPFLHFCHANLIPQLQEAVADLPNILLEPFESELWPDRKREAINTWKNHGDEWVNSPLRWDWSAYTIWHHGVIAKRMGYSSPFTRREHLLFDYPALNPWWSEDPIDFLIGDSAPSSGQYNEWADHSKEPLSVLIQALRDAGRSVITTSYLRQTGGCSVTQIGRASHQYRHHIMVPNGPFWPALNTTNHHHHEGRRRIVLLDNGENLNMPHIEQCRNVNEVLAIAREEKWI